MRSSGGQSREARRREGSRRRAQTGQQKSRAEAAPKETLCLHVRDAELLSQPPVTLGAPPTPAAAASANRDPDVSPAATHILTFSGASLFAFCLRRSARMNAEVQDCRSKGKRGSYQAEQWSRSSTRGSPHSPKGHRYPTSFRYSRDLRFSQP